MGHPVIRVERLSKKYVVGAGGASSQRTLRESIVDLFSAPRRKMSRSREERAPEKTFWALRDINFEIVEGMVTGVIGVNGAGKSTLLKILSHITQPTEGRSAVRGRVASLLEVGTGFHPELTGRENVLLNGAILGMTRSETLRKFDQIVEFADIARFVDTPVKRYSSGMYMRLAFAIAAHLDPEVLLVDEVLAVGDISFQRRCIGRMREVSQEGRTVLLVSHNLVSIEALCRQCLLLDAGKLVLHGPVAEVTREYRRRIQDQQETASVSLDDLNGDQRAGKVFTSLTLMDEFGEATRCFPVGGTFRAVIGVDLPPGGDLPEIVVRFDSPYHQRMLTIKNPASAAEFNPESGMQEIECHIPEFPLVPGEYWVGLAIYVNDQPLDEIDRIVSFTVINSDAFGNARGASGGVCVARSKWSVHHPSALASGNIGR